MASVKMMNKARPMADINSDENVLSMYLKEINRIPLLTREEEDSIARAAAAGDGKARERLANANLRFVVNVAKPLEEKKWKDELLVIPCVKMTSQKRRAFPKVSFQHLLLDPHIAPSIALAMTLAKASARFFAASTASTASRRGRGL